MMNPIQKALRMVHFRIPAEVLKETFIGRDFGFRGMSLSLDSRIRSEVIESIVIPDCKLTGGTLIDVPLGSIVPELVNMSSHVYRIPKELTQNRSISQAFHINLVAGMMVGNTSIYQQNTADVLSASQGVMESASSVPVISSAHVRMIGDNVLLVTNSTTLPRNASLNCRLEVDDQLSQLTKASYNRFAELVTLAVKAHVYNTLNIRIGEAALQGGAELGRFREVVDSYSDAAEMYSTYLDETWHKTMLLDDQASKEEIVRNLIGGWQ